MPLINGVLLERGTESLIITVGYTRLIHDQYCIQHTPTVDSLISHTHSYHSVLSCSSFCFCSRVLLAVLFLAVQGHMGTKTSSPWPQTKSASPITCLAVAFQKFCFVRKLCALQPKISLPDFCDQCGKGTTISCFPFPLLYSYKLIHGGFGGFSFSLGTMSAFFRLLKERAMSRKCP